MSGVLTIPELLKKKSAGEKITALTAFDCFSGEIVDKSGVDIILVGDSLGMVVLGYDSTLPVTLDEMFHHTKAVVRGVKRALVVADMPYLSYHISIEDGVRNAGRFLKECGASAIKLEGGNPHILKTVEGMVNAQIPVMGHLGLTPQSVHMMGGYRVQGREKEAADRIINEAVALEEAGVFSIVIEGVPPALGEKITAAVSVPTIGIGAGLGCDGQILVFHDLLGLTGRKPPKFAKEYASLRGDISGAISRYCADVREGSFPDDEHSY